MIPAPAHLSQKNQKIRGREAERFHLTGTDDLAPSGAVGVDHPKASLHRFHWIRPADGGVAVNPKEDLARVAGDGNGIDLVAVERHQRKGTTAIALGNAQLYVSLETIFEPSALISIIEPQKHRVV
jgi:hypothetical protein